MGNTIYAKARKLLPFIMVTFVIGLFVSCFSSDKVASSFSKRKYTKGHFYDRVAKHKVKCIPDNGNTDVAYTNRAQAQGMQNNTFTKSVVADGKDNFSIHAKSGLTNGIETANSTVSNKNVSLKQNLPYDPYHSYGGDHSGYEHHSSNASGYLLGWVICLIVSILFFLLLATLSVPASGAMASSEVGTGCLFLTISGMAFIAAIVLFILWIIALAR